MTTAEALERLHDAAFELLAIRSLRELEADCRAVIHMGMNAQQKTIPGPLDGFCRVPGVNPPRFVMVAATTTNLASLKSKWLAPLPDNESKPRKNETKTSRSKPKKDATLDEGDLTKARKRASELRKDNPTASFIVYLATNRNLPLELENVTRHTGDAGGLEVRFLEQSRLRDFVDTKPNGQWLRQEHLGIDADQVSVPLIRQLSETNLADYSRDVAMFADFAPSETKSKALVSSRLRHRSAILHLLVGSSGVGKSVTALGILRIHFASGGIGLWLPSETVENSLSLADAIRSVLAALHPSLGRDSGVATMALAADHGPIVLVIDDINRSNAPLRTLRKLLGWLRPDHSDTTGIHLAGKVKVLCPLWDAYWSSISSEAESSNWIAALRLTRFTRQETVTLLKTAPRPFSEIELDRYASALDDDPILVGLFVQMLRVQPTTDPMKLCHDAIGSFISGSIDELAITRGESADSYLLALQDLARQMVLRRSFHPKWKEVQEWFVHGIFSLQRLDALAAQGHICRIVDRDTPVIEFRHDRLFEFCVSNALERILREAETGWTPVFDPYYVPYLGRCLAQGDFGKNVLDRAMETSPAALVASLRFVSAGSAGYAYEITSRVTTWLSRARRSSAAMRHAVQMLREAETPFTIEVTESLKNDPPVWDARLRNGDAYAGALSLSHDFLPGSNNSWFEQLVEGAIEKHRDQLVNGIGRILDTQSNVVILGGALTLAGYLGDGGLSAAIGRLWARLPVSEKGSILKQALWASLRCASGDVRTLLVPILDSIVLLNDHVEDPSKLSERARLLSEIRFAARHGYGVPVLQYLVEAGDEERLEATVVAILECADHPIAIRFLATKLAWWSERAHQAKSFSHYANSWRENWENKHGGAPISPESLAELRLLWDDQQNPEWLRSYAFRCWVALTPDIESLKEAQCPIPEDGSSLWQRAQAGDRSATHDYLTHLDRDWHWLFVMPEIWSSELKPVASDWLSKLPETADIDDDNMEYMLGRLIRDIPVEDGETLLVKHWDILGNRKLFVQAALHVSTETTLHLAQQSIIDWPAEDDPFEHIDRYFFTGAYKIRPDDRLSLRQLEGLSPYVTRLDSQMLGEMIDFCGKRGYLEFARRTLLPEGRSRIAQFQSSNPADGWLKRSLRDWFPISQELAEELTRIATTGGNHKGFQIEIMLERFLKADQPLELLLETLEAWLTESPDKDRFAIASTLIRYWGRRSHLSILEKCVFAQSAAGQEMLTDSRYDVFRRSLE
jgi:hypothetical protein